MSKEYKEFQKFSGVCYMINEFSSAGILDVAQNACLRGCKLTPAGESLKAELDEKDKGK
jgi:hypothetical protein